MTIERQRSRILSCSLGFSFSRTEIFSTETESDWISVEKPGGVLEVLEAAGGKLRVAQGHERLSEETSSFGYEFLSGVFSPLYYRAVVPP